MASPIIPVVKSVFVCDDVVRDPASGKVSVLNLWETVRPAAGARFPYALKKLRVFAWLQEGRGRVRTRIDIVQGATLAVVGRSADFILDFTTTISHYAVFRLDRFRFPAPGYYYVELYCENQFMDDQAVQVLPV